MRAEINLYNGDCLQAMKAMQDKQFDLAIVDPPCGIDLANMNMGAGKSKKASKIENRKWKPKDWDKNTPTKEYFDELFRVSKNQIVWGGNYFELPPCYGYVIWDKEIPEGLSFSDCEMAWHSFKKAARMFRYSAYLDKKSKFHPTQKPVKLYKWLLDKYAEKGQTVLDTHLGSGSIAVACWDMGFDLTAYEIDKEYYDKACKRFEQHSKQMQLW
jgi:site-specific DNA-methyltransferase (adenine-specific)